MDSNKSSYKKQCNLPKPYPWPKYYLSPHVCLFVISFITVSMKRFLSQILEEKNKIERLNQTKYVYVCFNDPAMIIHGAKKVKSIHRDIVKL